VASRPSVRVGRAGTSGPGATALSILQIVAPGEVGGLESVVLALSAGQTQRGHNVTVAVVSEPRLGEHPFVSALAAAGVKTVAYSLPPRAYLKERELLRELCDREKPDVVHTHGYRPDILHVASRLRRNFAAVTTLHGSSRVGGISTVHEMLQKAMLRRFDAVIAVSRHLSDELRGTWVRPNRLHVVQNGWRDGAVLADRDSARRHLGLAPDGFAIGWVGRLIPIKGADVFLQAIHDLDALPARFSIVGDGSERQNLEEFARSRGLSDRVRFHGSVPDAARYLRAFDMLVLSSRSEGIPVTLLEAMAAGVPVVATSVGGIPEVVGSAEAELVRSEDHRALANAIRSVIEDPAAAAQRAAAATHHLHTNFGMTKWIDAHDRVYELIASGRTRRSHRAPMRADH
jgi:glycosyltransferase involved in cell wall biosynthesis